MKKKLFMLISIILFISLTGTAAICSMCGINLTTESTAGTDNEEIETAEEISGKETDKNESKATGEANGQTEEKKQEIINFTFDPKSGPEGTEVKLYLSEPIDSPVEVYYNGQVILWVIFTKTASPDGKTLTVNIPAGAGSDYFELRWEDKSVKSSEQFNVTIPAVLSFEVPKVTSEGGYVAMDGNPINAGGCLYTGDNDANKYIVGYLSFDITGLAGVAIDSAYMEFHVKQKWGDPTFYSSICVYDTYWGNMPISSSTTQIGGTPIQYIDSATDGNFTVNVELLKTQLQKAIDNGYQRFQIGVSPQGTITNNNNSWDGIEWDQSGISLNVTYAN